MRKSVLFSTLITILMFTSLTATSSYAAEQDGFTGWVYKANHFLFGINNPNSITGYQVSALPDLKPTGITYPSTIVEGDNVLFDSGVKNTGGSDSGGFNVKWFIDGQQAGYGGHDSVAAGQTVMDGNSFLAWTATAGQHTIQFVFDVDNSVQESDEQGNYAEVTVSVGQTVPDACQTVISKVNAALGSSCGSASYNFGADLNSDKRVDNADSYIIDQHKYDANWCASSYLLAKNPCETVCVRANPTVMLSPNSQDGIAGGNVSYKATIVNNDNSACGPSVFGRSGKWWRTGTAINDITDEYSGRSLPSISPGWSLSFDVYVALLDSAQAGAYYPALLVENSAAPSYSTEASATLNVKSSSTGTGTTVSCPISISVSSNKQTAYSQGETAVFTITMRDANGNIVKRGASLGITSGIDGSLKFGKAFEATDSGVIKVEVPLKQDVYPQSGYAVSVTSEAGNCDTIGSGQSFAVQAATNRMAIPADCSKGETVVLREGSKDTYLVAGKEYDVKAESVSSMTAQFVVNGELVKGEKGEPYVHESGDFSLDDGAILRTLHTVVDAQPYGMGFCIQRAGASTIPTSCTDSDNGLNYFTKGIASDAGQNYKDYCVDRKTTTQYVGSCSGDDCGLFEAYCATETFAGYYDTRPATSGREADAVPVFVPCSNGCKDGACISAREYAGAGYCKMELPFGCIDLQVTTEKISAVIMSPEEAKIFDGGIYINGENCEQKDYVDFTKNPFTMTCSKKSNPGQTLKGELVIVVQNEEGNSVQHKGSFEGLVESVKPVEVKPTLPESIGSAGIPVETEGFRLNIAAYKNVCQGCLNNNKCLPFGVRLDKKYCDTDGSFKDQKALKADCENNFECRSNTCLSSICTDLEARLTETQNLLEKIMGILGKLFGRIYE